MTHKEIELELPCDLTDEELLLRGREQAAAMERRDQVAADKAEATRAYSDQLKGIEERMRVLSRAVTSKIETRLVRCLVRFHTPTVRIKQIVRLDTGEIVRDEPMTINECQQHLFDLGVVELEPAAGLEPGQCGLGCWLPNGHEGGCQAAAPAEEPEAQDQAPADLKDAAAHPDGFSGDGAAAAEAAE